MRKKGEKSPSMGVDLPLIFLGRLGTRWFGSYSLLPSYTGVQEGAFAARMNLGVVVEPRELRVPPNVIEPLALDPLGAIAID
jgi:hypothetical protein